MLVERLPRDRSGDELRELYRRYAGELFGFAASALGDREQAEEVVQDVFAQLWRHAGEYDQRREEHDDKHGDPRPTMSGSASCNTRLHPDTYGRVGVVNIPEEYLGRCVSTGNRGARPSST